MTNDQTFDKTCAQLAEKFNEKKEELERLKSESRSITFPSAIRNLASGGALATCGYFAYVGFQPIATEIGLLVDVVLFPSATVYSVNCLKKISETINPDQIIEKVAVMELLNEIQGKQNEEEASKNILKRIASKTILPKFTFEGIFSTEENYEQTEEEKFLEALINIGRGVGEKADSQKKESLSKTNVFKQATEFFPSLSIENSQKLQDQPRGATNLPVTDLEQGIRSDSSTEEKQNDPTSSIIEEKSDNPAPSVELKNPNQNQQNQDIGRLSGGSLWTQSNSCENIKWHSRLP